MLVKSHRAYGSFFALVSTFSERHAKLSHMALHYFDSLYSIWFCSALQVQSQSATQKTIINRDSRSMLGIWSAADVIWGLCPGVRELKGHERPTLAADIVELFHELGPTERKVIMRSTPIF